MLRLLRRRSLAALRHEVEPVDPRQYARFLPSWQGVGRRMRGREGVLRVVEQLSGVRLPASAVESLVLPARMGEPAGPLLDELTAAGEILWSGHGAMAGDDLWVSLHLAETAPQTLPLPDRDDLDPVEEGAPEASAADGDEAQQTTAA